MVREEKEDWVRNCKGARLREKLRETWLEVVKNDMKDLGIASADVLGWHAWRRKIVGDRC